MGGVLDTRIQELGVNVTIKGHIDSQQLSRVLPTYDAFILPSFSEGNPLSVLEAIASMTPVVLSNIAANQEVAGSNALYFDPNKSGELAAILKNVFVGNHDLQEMAGQAYSSLPPTSVQELYIERLKEIYNAAPAISDENSWFATGLRR